MGPSVTVIKATELKPKCKGITQIMFCFKFDLVLLLVNLCLTPSGKVTDVSNVALQNKYWIKSMVGWLVTLALWILMPVRLW